jgi:hypothetical protein
MADRWFFGRGDSRFGPFSASELRAFMVDGQLQPTDTVWKEGTEAGMLASRVKNLFPPSAMAPAAVLTTPPAPAPTHEHNGANKLTGEGKPTGDSESLLSPSAEGPAPAVASPTPAAAEPAAHAAPETHSRRLPNKEKAHVQSVQGGILLSEDGKYLQYRKKCRKCGFEDAARSSLPIKNGVVRQIFYCPKCRKPSDVEIRGRA